MFPPRRLKMASKMWPLWPKMASKMVQDGLQVRLREEEVPPSPPKKPPRRPKTAQEVPKRPPRRPKRPPR
eukprot:7250927-Pyramimonas_sp.AAC.1